MLIQQFLPEFDIRNHHAVLVKASPAKTYRIIEELNPRDSWSIRILFLLRGLRSGPTMKLADLQSGFVLLAEEPGREIVLGVTGRFWKPRGGLRRVDPAGFKAFAEPGYAKAAMNFLVQPAPGGSLVSTETRVVATDDASRRSFLRYWRVIGPFSSLIRKRMLALVKARAEAE